ncbi:EAL domain-containing protein [bacterium 210820-DFI.6.52]|nr:EAL domain-containing protein [bacterium 210820-DFI.6.52]
MKAGRKRSGRTILQKMLIPVTAIVLAQAALYAVVFLQGGVLSHTDANAYDILGECTINRQLYLENEMVHRWSNVKEHETAILSSVEETLKAQGATLGDIATDAALNAQILDGLSDSLVYMLRKNGVTGAFVVLDGVGVQGDESGQSRAGLYLRDLDPVNNSSGVSDILMERGMPTTSRRMGIPLDSYWRADFLFTGEEGRADEQFFLAPLNAARASTNRESSNFGYWSPAFSLSGQDGQVITYSIPLIASDGTVFGVMGVDITQSYLTSLMNYEELGVDHSGAYILAVTDKEGQQFQTVFSSGSLYQVKFGVSQEIVGKKSEHKNISTFTRAGEEGKSDLYGSVQPFSLYNTNTPFEGQQWVLIGLCEGDTLLQFSHQIRQIIYLCTVAALLLGILGAVLASRMVAKPITALVQDLKRSDPNKPIKLKKLDIEEIDQLTISIENLSNAAAESASKFGQIISTTNIPVGVFEYAPQAPSVFCSTNIFPILGWPQEEQVDGRLPREVFEQRMQALQECLVEDGEEGLLYRLPSGPEGERWVRLTFLKEGGQILGAITDVSKDMAEKRKIEYERDYDILTNLYNRRAFAANMERLFETPEVLGTAALLMWDLDNLKFVNDNYGHDSGDRYIEAFARCLSAFLSEQSLVARRSGDEFYVFLYGYQSKEKIRQIIRKVWMQIGHTTFPLAGKDFKIRVSGGLAWYPDDASSYEDLIRYADFAMYSVKHSEKGSIQEFERTSYQADSFLVRGQEELKRLIDHRLVRFAYQPVLEVATGSVYGYELLMRSQVEALRSPVDVLRIARAQSKLYQIERLTWFEAMASFSQQVKAGQIGPNERAFVNSIASQSLTGSDITALEDLYGPYLERVVMEITEQEPWDNERTRFKIRTAKRWGGQLAIDDFGSGYNSESLLIFLSPDIVKVDIAIVHDIDRDGDRLSLLENLLSYAHSRGIKVLAEGVETRAEMETLVARGVDYLQGYYVARPQLEIAPVEPDVLRAIQAAREKIQ